MKKYYAIYITVGIIFLLCAATLFFNPDSIILPGRLRDVKLKGETIQTSTIGDIFIAILGVVIILAIIATIIYRIYRFIQKTVRKKDFSSDAKEMYTEKQSSENISKWLISSRQGYLDKDEDK